MRRLATLAAVLFVVAFTGSLPGSSAVALAREYAANGLPSTGLELVIPGSTASARYSD